MVKRLGVRNGFWSNSRTGALNQTQNRGVRFARSIGTNPVVMTLRLPDVIDSDGVAWRVL